MYNNGRQDIIADDLSLRFGSLLHESQQSLLQDILSFLVFLLFLIRLDLKGNIGRCYYQLPRTSSANIRTYIFPSQGCRASYTRYGSYSVAACCHVPENSFVQSISIVKPEKISSSTSLGARCLHLR